MHNRTAVGVTLKARLHHRYSIRSFSPPASFVFSRNSSIGSRVRQASKETLAIGQAGTSASIVAQRLLQR